MKGGLGGAGKAIANQDDNKNMLSKDPLHTWTHTHSCVQEKRFSLLSFLSQRIITLFSKFKGTPETNGT